MQVILGADHAGFEYKQEIHKYLEKKGVEVRDLGAETSESSDYPDYAHAVAQELALADDKLGILICGSGIGMSIAANRMQGVRAARCETEPQVQSARAHNNINCLTLGARDISIDRARDLVDSFLEVEFEQGRHSRRVDKIDTPQLMEVKHPLVQSKLTKLRDRETSKKKFRELIGELTGLMFYEATRSCQTGEEVVRTPLTEAHGRELLKRILLVPILRAGLGMVDPILKLVPTAKVGHVGLYRDEESLEPVEYYLKLPEQLDNSIVLLLDPMLATGGSASKAFSLLKEKGFTDNLRFLCLVAAPEGVEKIREDHPDVSIYTASVDEELNDEGYIIPGLGDAGDRLFGTV